MPNPPPVTITAKFYIGQTVYVIFYSTLDIRPVVVSKVHLDTNGSLRYYCIVADDVWSRTLEDMKEEELYYFDEARVVLLAFLEQKTLEINSMVQP